MILNDNDYKAIASQIEEGTGTIEYQKDGETLEIEYTFSVEGYVEDDYINGTGAFVETYRSLYIANADSFNENGDTTATDFDEETLRQYVA